MQFHNPSNDDDDRVYASHSIPNAIMTQNNFQFISGKNLIIIFQMSNLWYKNIFKDYLKDFSRNIFQIFDYWTKKFQKNILIAN